MSDKMIEQNTSLIDLKALSEPACKLIDTVKDGIGVMYLPAKAARTYGALSESIGAAIKEIIALDAQKLD